MRLGIMIVLMGMLSFSAASRAEDKSSTLILIGPSYPGLIEPSGEGRYQQHIKAAIEGQGIALEERVLPVKRALLSFLDQGGDCIYGMNLPVRSAGKSEKMVQSPTLTNVKLFIFQRKGQPPVVSVQQVPAKTRIGGVLGNEAYYEESVKKGHVIDYVTEDRLNIEKLRYNRLSYIYGFFPNLDSYRDELSFNEKRPILEIPDSIICYDNPKTKKFIATLNQRLQPVVENEKQRQKQNDLTQSKQRKIWMLKDLLADILPPPLFIIESHLMSLQISLAIKERRVNMGRIEELIKRALQLQSGQVPNRENSGFNERVDFWKSQYAPDKEGRDVWDSYVQGPLISAQTYLSTQEIEFFPAIRNRDFALAEKILREKLNPIYAQHRAQIDGVVAKVLVAEDRLKDKPEAVMRLRDLLIDIFPPPLFLIEPFLTTERIFAASLLKAEGGESENLSQLVWSHQALQGESGDVFESTSYQTRMDFWQQILKSQMQDEPEIKEKLEKSFQQGKKYFKWVNEKVLVNAPKSRFSEKALELQKDLVPRFAEHEATIEDLALLIRKRLKALQTP